MMKALEQLFLLEVEFHRKLRTEGLERDGGNGVHTSYALQCGYEELVRAAGAVSDQDVEQLRERLALAGDTRDVLAARDSVMQLLGVRPGGS
jgi:hypothetical protein